MFWESKAVSETLTLLCSRNEMDENCRSLTCKFGTRDWLSCSEEDVAQYFFCLLILIVIKVKLHWVPCRMKSSGYAKGHISTDTTFSMAVREIQMHENICKHLRGINPQFLSEIQDRPIFWPHTQYYSFCFWNFILFS